MLQTENIEIGGINYELRKANFFEAKNMAMSLSTLLNGAVKFKDGNTDIDFGAILSNLKSDEMEKVQEFVLKYATADGVKLASKIEAEKHFNAHRANYFQLVFEGLKFHFADFFPNGAEFVKNISLDKVVKAVK